MNSDINQLYDTLPNSNKVVVGGGIAILTNMGLYVNDEVRVVVGGGIAILTNSSPRTAVPAPLWFDDE